MAKRGDYIYITGETSGRFHDGLPELPEDRKKDIYLFKVKLNE